MIAHEIAPESNRKSDTEGKEFSSKNESAGNFEGKLQHLLDAAAAAGLHLIMGSEVPA